MSLRIGASAPPRRAPRRGPDGAARRPGTGLDELRHPDGETYMSRLVKLIPAETAAVYPFLNARAEEVAGMTESSRGDVWIVWLTAWVMLGLTVVLRAFATRDEHGPQWGAVFIAAGAFALWASALGGGFGVGPALAEALGGQAIELNDRQQSFLFELALITWTILAPLLYQPAAASDH